MHFQILCFFIHFSILMVLTLGFCCTVDARAIVKYGKRSFEWQNQVQHQQDDDIDWSSLDAATSSGSGGGGGDGGSRPSPSDDRVVEYLQQHYPHEYEEYARAVYMRSHPRQQRAIELKQQGHRTVTDIRQAWKAQNHPAYQVLLNQGRKRYHQNKSAANSYASLLEQERRKTITPEGQERLHQIRMKYAMAARRRRQGGQGGTSD